MLTITGFLAISFIVFMVLPPAIGKLLGNKKFFD